MKKKFGIILSTVILIMTFLSLKFYNNGIFYYKLSQNNKLAGNVSPLADDLTDKVYFFNTNDSDFILIASNGHYGLVDTANRYSNRITDSDGMEYDISTNGLSSQTYFSTGKDVAKYMVNALGVDHLDFVIGTHAHSDHIGGVEEICQQKLSNGNYLLDDRTFYFYKTYHHMSDEDDDLDEDDNKVTRANTWHNQAYAYTAKQAMKDRGAQLINVSNGAKIEPVNQYRFADVSKMLNPNSHLLNAKNYAGKLNTYYDDYIEFKFGNYNMRLYNLFTSESGYNENVNSIVTLITKGNTSIVLTGDIDFHANTEVLIAEEIYNYVGHVDLYKMAHHTNFGSNAKEVFDLLQPGYCIGTRRSVKSNQAERGYLVTRYYATNNYNTEFYETCQADKAIVVSVENDSLSFNELYDTSNNSNNPNVYNPNVRALNPRTLDINNEDYVGWNRWRSYGYNNWMYIEKDSNNQYNVVTGWINKDGYWYFADTNGLIKHGWNSINGNWYYFANPNEVLESENSYYPEGAMVKGWKLLEWNGEKYWFYFAQSGNDIKIENTDNYYPEGAMITGWQKMEFNGTNYWFYFTRNPNDIDDFPTGAMITGRQNVDYLGNRDYYYFAKSSDEFSEYVKGAMVKNKTIDGFTYNGNGVCTNNDTTKPTITASNITYGDILSIRLQDDHSGILAWQVNQSSTEPTSDWDKVAKTNDTTVTKAGLSAGTYYIWAKDNDKNIASKQITVNKKQIEVTWNNINIFTYNGDNQGPTLTNTQISGVNNEILNMKVNGYQTEVGTNYTATAVISSVSGGQQNKNNYVLNGQNKTFSIINSVALGDLNNNTMIDTGDIIMMYRHIAFENNPSLKDKHPEWELSEDNIQIGDLNKNGRIDIGDTLKLQRYISASNSSTVAAKHPDWLVLN